MSTTYVVIGSSAAGIAAASKIRDFDATSSITCLTLQQHPPYNRCLLADVLGGSKQPDQINLKPANFFAEKNITLRYGTRVEGLDVASQRVTLASGEAVAYDKLFIGSGRSGWVPPLPGSTLPGVLQFFGLADVHAIMAYQGKHTVKHIVVVGGGHSGLECADALAAPGIQITLVERSGKVLPHQINGEGSAFLIKLAEKFGITTRTHVEVMEIGGSSRVQQVMLSDGSVIPADMVVFAIGGKTNSEFAQQAGITLVGRAIDVDPYMRTSATNVFAGGDVAAVIDVQTGQKVQNCLWPDAVMQGMVAAYTMTGNERQYGGTVMVTSSTIFDLTFVTAGPVAYPPAGSSLMTRSEAGFYHALLVDAQNALLGFVLIGNVSNVGALRKALVEKRALG